MLTRFLHRVDGGPRPPSPLGALVLWPAGRVERAVRAIEADALALAALDDAGLRAAADALRADASTGVPPPAARAFALVCEACRRAHGLRPHRAQLRAGLALLPEYGGGGIAELPTGGGKTLVAAFPLFARALDGAGVHLVTTNDYLARIGAGTVGPILARLGLTVAAIGGGVALRHDVAATAADGTTGPGPDGLVPCTRAAAYRADVTYGPAAEFVFDWLDDRGLVRDPAAIVGRGLHAAIVDEVDSILLDDALTPVLKATLETVGEGRYREAAAIARALRPADHLLVDPTDRTAILAPCGIDRVARMLGLADPADLFAAPHAAFLPFLHAAIEALVFYRRGEEYYIEDGRIVLVDPFTGRALPGRQWADGLHQSVEAREGLPLTPRNRTVAQIGYGEFFRLYRHLAGLSGSVGTATDELARAYGLRATTIAPEARSRRVDRPDRVYRARAERDHALLADLRRRHAIGQPTLVIASSMGDAARLAAGATALGLPHHLLDAREHAREAAIVAGAGAVGAVTIATAMAGRGTDIRLGPGAAARGGLAVLIAGRHEHRRGDRQARGRAGRQGEPGETVAFLALDDDLVRRYGDVPPMPSGPIPPRLLARMARAIDRAQLAAEGRAATARLVAADYAAIVGRQRGIVYALRDEARHGRVADRWLDVGCAALPTRALGALAARPADGPLPTDGWLALADYLPASSVAAARGAGGTWGDALAAAGRARLASATPGSPEGAIVAAAALDALDRWWPDQLETLEALREVARADRVTPHRGGVDAFAEEALRHFRAGLDGWAGESVATALRALVEAGAW